jgi:NitT/TauT family transport system ATP-binding protein
MSGFALDVGFLPLVDCAPLVVAHELGFAAEEGFDLRLRREPSWSALRDKLAMGRLDAVHMLSPVPVAMSMGLGGLPQRVDALMVLSVNGNMIGVSNAIAARMHAAGPKLDFMDAAAVGRRLIEVADRPIRVGAPFPFSMHAELLYYWFNALGLAAPQGLIVRTIPPPLMADAVAAGEIDAFCVGEPWGTATVESGAGELILPGSAIWRFAPEKVLAARHDWVEDHPAQVRALMRAVWRAARWLSGPDARITTSELLARPEYLDLPAELIDRALTGRLLTAMNGAEESPPGFLEFHAGAANFPWRSQAIWIATRIADRLGLDRAEAATAARACFRSDLYRANLGPIGADLPGASEKVEGALSRRTPVASSTGEMFLGPDCFFDRQQFDPDL